MSGIAALGMPMAGRLKRVVPLEPSQDGPLRTLVWQAVWQPARPPPSLSRGLFLLFFFFFPQAEVDGAGIALQQIAAAASAVVLPAEPVRATVGESGHGRRPGEGSSCRW